jgi:cyclopropane-fatty-acyl-phospholipid synthase
MSERYDTLRTMQEPEKIIKALFAKADIAVNGQRDWDIQIHNPKCYGRFIQDQTLGFGESYMDGWWDAKQLDETMARIIKGQVSKELRINTKLLLYMLRHKVMNFSAGSNNLTTEQLQYDPDNALYESMLDQNMNYSCGYWKNLGNIEISWKIPRNLAKAQEAKLELICRKIHLKKGQKVLDIGCGWGNFAKYAAEKYGAHVVGITISKQQAVVAKKHCKGLPVKILVQDYRDFKNGQYDKIVSIGMIEHEVHKNYDIFMQIVAKHLKQDGLFLLHTIGSNTASVPFNPWSEKYIFPNSHIPSLTQLTRSIEDRFIVEDLHNFGVYYYPTLMSWFRNFNKNWKKLAGKDSNKYNERFYRMWKFYLLSSAGLFKSRALHVWQLVLSNRNTLAMYIPIR